MIVIGVCLESIIHRVITNITTYYNPSIDWGSSFCGPIWTPKAKPGKSMWNCLVIFLFQPGKGQETRVRWVRESKPELYRSFCWYFLLPWKASGKPSESLGCTWSIDLKTPPNSTGCERSSGCPMRCRNLPGGPAAEMAEAAGIAPASGSTGWHPLLGQTWVPNHWMNHVLQTIGIHVYTYIYIE